MKQLALNYFAAWNAQDADWLQQLLHDDVTLQDWDVSGNKILEVMLLNKGIWEKVPNIKAQVISIAENNDKCMCQLLIQIDDNTSIDVVDVFTMKDGKITSIKAYKG
jgi:hypothetical protein